MRIIAVLKTYFTQSGTMWSYAKERHEFIQLIEDLRAKGVNVETGFDEEHNFIAYVPEARNENSSQLSLF